MTGRTALITGVAGQDGIYLARLLLAEGMTVVGTVRPESATAARCATYLDGVRLEAVDIRDTERLAAIIAEHRPHEIYNLAAFTSVGRSWAAPKDVAAINGQAVRGLLESVRSYQDRSGEAPHVFHASSAEVAAGGDNPYSTAKAAAEAAVDEFRDEHGLYACYAALHNHESPLRGKDFVTRKITRHVARIHLGATDPLVLGNLDVRRDWGFAGDHVDAMRRMLRLDTPLDLEIGTGVSHSLRDLVAVAFATVGITDAWAHTTTDPALVRPSDLPELVADTAPARQALGWQPTVSFEDTIANMVEVDVTRLRSGVAEDLRYLAPPRAFASVTAAL